MDLRVGAVFAGRLGPPGNTAVVVSWLYVTGPDIATEIRVLDWGDGSAGVVVPTTPTTAFTANHAYYDGTVGFVPVNGVARFAAAVLGEPGFGDVDSVAVYLDPDAAAGVTFSLASSALPVLIGAGAFGDTLAGGLREDTVYAGAGGDSVAGGGRRDGLFGEAGDDSLDGGAGNDFLYGGTGADLLRGGGGVDVLYGDSGNDSLEGGGANDVLYGFGDDDLLRGGGGADSLYGGIGDNTLEGGAGGDSLSAEAGDDRLAGEAGDDTLDAGEGRDTLLGGTGADALSASTGTDSLNGGDGDDTLFGQAGDDTIHGGADADLLVGGLGADRLVLAADGAADVVRYDSLAEGGDRIIGFEQGLDRIRIEAASSGPLLVGIRPGPVDPIGTYLFNTATSRFSYDPDGTGDAAPVLIATLVGVTSFSGADLLFTV